MFFCWFFCYSLQREFCDKSDRQKFILGEDSVAYVPVDFLWRASSYRLPVGRFGNRERLHSGDLLGRVFGVDIRRTGDALVSNTIL